MRGRIRSLRLQRSPVGKLNLALGMFSLSLGIILMGVTWGRGGTGLSLGVILGLLLLLNGGVRLWVASRSREGK